MKSNKIAILTSALLLGLALSGSAFAGGNKGGGEGNNTGCNGVGNPNSPCQPTPPNDGGGGAGGDGGDGGAGGNGTGVGVGVGVGHGGNGTGGNATGGNSSSGGNTMTGGDNTATGGAGGNSNATGGEGGNANQGQSQGIEGSGNSTNNVGSASGASSDASNSGGNSNTSVDASDNSSYSFSSRTTFIPAVVPSNPPSVLGVGNVTTVVGACGPLQTVVKTEIQGTYIGLFRKSRVSQGYDEMLAPYIEDGKQVFYREIPLGDGSVRLMGHQPITFATVVGVASSRNLALGGGSDTGDWGQAGGGSSSSMQQVVTRVQLRDCEVGTLVPAKPVLVEVEPKGIGQ